MQVLQACIVDIGQYSASARPPQATSFNLGWATVMVDIAWHNRLTLYSFGRGSYSIAMLKELGKLFARTTHNKGPPTMHSSA